MKDYLRKLSFLCVIAAENRLSSELIVSCRPDAPKWAVVNEVSSVKSEIIVLSEYQPCSTQKYEIEVEW